VCLAFVDFVLTCYSLIAAEGAIANVVGMTQMNPPVKDLREY
jgi:splicing factor 3B subunit 1